MKSKITILIFFFSLIILSENSYFYKEFLNEEDYFRAVEEYKRYFFETKNIKNAEYCIKIASIYSLSGYDTFAVKYLDELLNYDVDEKYFLYESLIRSFINFKNGDVASSLLEIEDYTENGMDTLTILLEFLKNAVNGDVDSILNFIDDSIKSQINEYKKVKLKNPDHAFLLSSFLPGAGEFYAGYPIDGLRDLSLNLLSTLLFVYAFIKSPDNFSIERVEFSKDYLLKRDYFLTIFVNSFFVSRFQNGSKINAYRLALKKNEEIHKKYLSSLYFKIENLFEKKIKGFILSN